MKWGRFEEVGFGKGVGETKKRLVFGLNDSKQVVSVDLLSLSYYFYFKFWCCITLHFRIPDATYISSPHTLAHVSRFFSWVLGCSETAGGMVPSQWNCQFCIATFSAQGDRDGSSCSVPYSLCISFVVGIF